MELKEELEKRVSETSLTDEQKKLELKLYEYPFKQPPGTIRDLVLLLITIAVIVLSFMGKIELNEIAFMVFGYYFGSRKA